MKLAFALLSSALFAQGEAPKNDHSWIKIPQGTYLLGAEHEVLNPAHTAKTAGFLISATETTNAQFAVFTQETSYKTRAERNGWSLIAGKGSGEWQWQHCDGASWRQPFGPSGPSAHSLPNHPVTQISGEDARAYCNWLGGRLPTLDEWEIAARGGAKTRYPWGAELIAKNANTWNGLNHKENTGEDGFVLTAPVRSYPPNAFGLYDVIGNVFEYCEGHPPWMTQAQAQNRICGRGGSWWCSRHCCDFHNLLDIGSMIKTASLPNQGFRVVMGEVKR